MVKKNVGVNILISSNNIIIIYVPGVIRKCSVKKDKIIKEGKEKLYYYKRFIKEA